MISQAGINADLFGLRVEMGHPEVGRITRDYMAFSALLDRFATLERPICISAASAPSEPMEPALTAPPRTLGSGSPPRPRTPVPPHRLEPRGPVPVDDEYRRIALSKPYVHSFCWNELYDPPRRAPRVPVRRAPERRGPTKASDGPPRGDPQALREKNLHYRSRRCQHRPRLSRN